MSEERGQEVKRVENGNIMFYKMPLQYIGRGACLDSASVVNYIGEPQNCITQLDDMQKETMWAIIKRRPSGQTMP